MVWWVRRRVEVMSEQEWCEAIHDAAGSQRRLRNGQFNAAKAQEAAAVR